MVELYMDKLNDLMATEPPSQGKLEIREDPSTGMISILNVMKH